MVNPMSPWNRFWLLFKLDCFGFDSVLASAQIEKRIASFCMPNKRECIYVYTIHIYIYILYIYDLLYVYISYNIKCSLYKRYLQMFLWAHRSIAAFSRNKAGRVDFQWIRRSATLIGQSSVHYRGSTAVPALPTLSLSHSRCPSLWTYSIDNCSLSFRRYFGFKFWITQNKNKIIFSFDFAHLVSANTWPYLPWFYSCASPSSSPPLPCVVRQFTHKIYRWTCCHLRSCCCLPCWQFACCFYLVSPSLKFTPLTRSLPLPPSATPTCPTHCCCANWAKSKQLGKYRHWFAFCFSVCYCLWTFVPLCLSSHYSRCLLLLSATRQLAPWRIVCAHGGTGLLPWRQRRRRRR